MIDVSRMNGTTPFRVVGVGSANVLRGPIFEAVMNHTLHEERKDLAGLVSVTSGGLDIELMKTNTEPLSRLAQLLCSAFENDGVVPDELIGDVAVYYAMFSAGVKQEGIAALTKEDTFTMRRLYSILQPRRWEQQTRVRNEALQKAGISGQYHPESLKPFQPHHGYRLVLAMERRYLPKTSLRYHNEQPGKRVPVDIFQYNEESGTVSIRGRHLVSVPKITEYSEFAEMPFPSTPTDGSQEEITAASQQVTYFMDTRRTALDKIAEMAATAKQRLPQQSLYHQG